MDKIRQASGTHSRRSFLQHTGLGLVALTAWATPRAHGVPSRPNVLLIMTDDQGYGDLSCLGNPVLQTPHLDELHRQSLRLTNFHVSPTCAPTRASLMTGRYNNRTGVWHTIMGRSILRRDEITMADYFKKAGYQTGIFGKWHLGDTYPYRPEDRGFDEVLVHGGGGVGQTPDYWGNNYQDDTYFHNGTPKACPGYCTDVWFNAAQEFMSQQGETPFFCYLPTNVPHGPFLVADKYKKPFEEKGLKEGQAAFYGMLTHFDECVGRLMKALDDAHLADNTIVIFMTDNGTAAGDKAGMRGTKGSEFEGGHRVPCFIRWPDGKWSGGKDIPELSAHIDLLPTLLETCGIAQDESMPFDGISLTPWLADITHPAAERAIVVDSQRIDHPEKWRKSAVLEGRWRLINGKELYDVDKDPAQERDVASKHPDIVARLTAHYDRWWTDTSARFDEYCPMVIGAAGQGVSHLTCHDWHAPIKQVPWNQPYVRDGRPGQGFWVVEVEQEGSYQFDLRRWPVESNGTMRGSVDGGKALEITEARVHIADLSESTPVSATDQAATFTLTLPKGQHRLQTTLVEANGSERGAYYVSIKKVAGPLQI